MDTCRSDWCCTWVAYLRGWMSTSAWNHHWVEITDLSHPHDGQMVTACFPILEIQLTPGFWSCLYTRASRTIWDLLYHLCGLGTLEQIKLALKLKNILGFKLETKF